VAEPVVVPTGGGVLGQQIEVGARRSEGPARRLAAGHGLGVVAAAATDERELGQAGPKA
jgi:hypothetical protein